MPLKQQDTQLDLQRPHSRRDVGLHSVQLGCRSIHAAVPGNCLKDSQIGCVHNMPYLQK
jgi:hypothetical protein